jgi:pimeloyl-ACP methyl ester carboxylesterase
MNYTEAFVQRDRYRIYVREFAGEEPAIILMHGFPDNLHLYDRLVPYLWPLRHVVTFDFLGWGDAVPSARPAFYSLNEDLLPTVRSRSKMIPKLKEFKRPVRIIFGDSDPYLNKGVAQKFHEIFPTSHLFLLPGARHFVQMDEPKEVARLILSTPVAENTERHR